METSEFNTDIFYKAERKKVEEQVNDVFNISPLLFKASEGGISDITDTQRMGSRLINVHKILIDSEYLPELSDHQSVQKGGSFSETSEMPKDSKHSATSEFSPRDKDETVSSFSLPMNRFISESISEFSYTTEEGLTTTSSSDIKNSSTNTVGTTVDGSRSSINLEFDEKLGFD